MKQKVNVQNMKTNLLKWRFAGAVILLFLLSGCLKSDDPITPTPKAYISILHLAPTAPSLDVYFNENRVSNAPFTPGSVTAGYNTVDKGSFSIKFKKIGTDSLVAEIPMSQYDSLSFYTLFIHNLDENGPAKATRIKDSFTGLDQTKSYYRFYHGSPNAGNIDLYIDNVKISSDRVNGDNTINAFLNSFEGISSGVHTIEVKTAGTDTVLTSLVVDLFQGNAYTFYLKGLKGGTGNSVLALGNLRAN